MKDDGRPVLMPSEVSTRVGFFERFAGRCAHLVGRAAFFTFCVVLVVIWVPSILAIRDIDTWQLIINTLTTIVTFLLVALLQNTQTRADEALQHKLNALADGLADLMAAIGEDKPALRKDMVELRDAVGLEERESA